MAWINEPFLRLHIPKISSTRRDSILNSMDFYYMALAHSLLIMIVSFVFLLATILQVASLEISSEELTSATILFSLLLSFFAARTIGSLKSMGNFSSEIGGTQFEKLDRNPKSGFRISLGYLFIAIFSLGFMAVISEVTGSSEKSLLGFVSAGDYLGFTLMMFFYILIAGSIGSFFSSMMLFWYKISLFVLALRTWLRRLFFYVKLEFNPGDESVEEALQGRCPQCCNDSYESTFVESERKFICSLCGLPGSIESHSELMDHLDSTESVNPSDELASAVD